MFFSISELDLHVTPMSDGSPWPSPYFLVLHIYTPFDVLFQERVYHNTAI